MVGGKNTTKQRGVVKKQTLLRKWKERSCEGNDCLCPETFFDIMFNKQKLVSSTWNLFNRYYNFNFIV